MRKIFIGLATSIGVASCSLSADVSAAQQGIAAFHSDLNGGAFAKIYDASATEMKSSISKQDFVTLLNGVHTKLGLYKNGKSVGWNDNAATNGHFVTVTYTALYQKGPADESFVYRVSGKQAALAGYHVTSNALVTG